MSQAVEELTEKEKEALRLLLAGHDAKSSARELGISHHTVNDRLRSARRKLEVSTSREAARLLGEAENAIPKPLVHTPLGSASADEPSHNPGSATGKASENRSERRWKGLILMSFVAAAALGAAIFTGQFTDRAASDNAATEQPMPAATGLEARIRNAQSLREARAFLALLDSGDAKASYKVTAGELRANQGFQLWELGVALRNNRADFSTRKIVGAGGRDDEPGPGEWAREVFIFSSTDGDRVLTEFLVTQRFEDGWKVVEYDLRGLDDEDD